MHFAEVAEYQALRDKIRAYLAELPPAPSADRSGWTREIYRRLGADGWLGIGWPVEFGGQARPIDEQFLLLDEVERAGIPFPFVTVNTVGPALMIHGSDEQKRRFLPGLLTGDINFAIGYTEPDAGTDLASLRTRARRDGDEFIVDGTKVFTSGADEADFVWLACRTNPDVSKHLGISVLIVPTDDPGFSWTPLHTVGGAMTTTTHYHRVRVPVANVVGFVDGGWAIMTSQLNHERIGLAAKGGAAEQLWDDTFRWCQATGATNTAWVRRELAYSRARLEAMRLLNRKAIETMATGDPAPASAAALKIYGTECRLDVYRTLRSILGAAGRLRPGSPGAALAGRVEHLGRVAVVGTFGGGNNDVLRDVVATLGAGLPRQHRA